MNFNKIKYKLTKYYLRAAKKTESYVSKLMMTEHLFMMIIASIVGLLVGFAAVGFKSLIHLISDLMYSGDSSLLINIAETEWYFKLIIPVFGALIVGPIVYFFAPETKGSGIPEVIESTLVKGGSIRARVPFVKAFVSSITIGTGGSVGKEGPMVQIGSALGSIIGKFLSLKTSRLKVLIGCGASAGIAAAFNAPVAGALFAIEVILMDFGIASFSPIVISSVIATVVSHAFGGNFAAFRIESFEFISNWEVFFYIILGGLSGIVSFLFIKFLKRSQLIFDTIGFIPTYLKAAFGALAVGCIGVFFPEVFGSGYDTIDAAINSKGLSYLGLGSDSNLSNYPFWILPLILVFIKMLATSFTVSSGGSGGVFAPSLFIGAMLGTFYGYLIHSIFPESSASYSAYAIVGMGGLVAGTTFAPITAIIIIFELTKENAIILPLMLTSIGSLIVSMKLSRESYYGMKLSLKNINISDRAETSIMKSILVADVYSKNFTNITENTKFSELVELLISEKVPYVSVLSMKGKYLGVISLHDIKDHLFDGEELNHVLIAGEICNPNFPSITPEENCRTALQKLNKNNVDHLIVLDPENPEYQIGLLWRKNIDDAYQSEMEKAELTSDLASKIKISNHSPEIDLLEGYKVTELLVPHEFVGKSLRELQVRSKYGVDILSIKQKNPNTNSFVRETITMIPEADHKLNNNDILIVAGEAEKVNILKSMV